MAKVLPIVHYPDPVLRQRCAPVEAVDERLRRLAEDMIATMHDAPGLGLAAPQVGVPLRMFAADPSGEGREDEFYINPVLEVLDDKDTGVREEGCLSLPEIRIEVVRPRRMRITYTRLDGSRVTAENDGLLARIWQHENDHLDGRLLLDRMTQLDRLSHRRRIKELEEEYAAAHPPRKAARPGAARR